MPLFIDQLAETWEQEAKGPKARLPEMTTGAVHHGRGLLKQGFTIGQVVHDYGDICQAVTELALETNAEISTDEFHTLNRCLDNATAEAVTEFGRQRDLLTSGEETERMGGDRKYKGRFGSDNVSSVSLGLAAGHGGRLPDRARSGYVPPAHGRWSGISS